MKFNEKELARWASSLRPDKEGLLEKKGAGRIEGYRQRWFRLKGNLLFYFTVDNFGGWENTGDPVGAIVLERCHAKRVRNETRPYAFTLMFEGDISRTYFLSAFSQGEMDAWIKAISVASYEGLRSLLYELQTKLISLTGEDPLQGKAISIVAPQFSTSPSKSPKTGTLKIVTRPSTKARARRLSSLQVSPLSCETLYELSLSCTNLPSERNGEPPSTMVRVRSYSLSKVTVALATLFHSETIDLSCSPRYSHLLLLDSGSLTSLPSCLLEFEVFSMDHCQLDTMESCPIDTEEDKCTDGFVVFRSQSGVNKSVDLKRGRLIGRAECMISAVTASTGNNKELNLPLSLKKLVCGFLHISVSKVDETHIGSCNIPRRNALNPPDSRSPIGILPPIMSHPVRCHFCFPATVRDKKNADKNIQLKVFEEMTESVFNVALPMELLKCYIREDMALLSELSTIGALNHFWSDKMMNYQAMLYEAIATYKHALKDMDDLGDTCGFKSSLQKREFDVRYIPCNLHIQQMRVQEDGVEEKSYCVVTFGCPADHVGGFKNGGLKRLLSECRSSPSFISRANQSKATSVRNAIAQVKDIKSSIYHLNNSLYRACANTLPLSMNDTMIGISKQIQQLLCLMETSTVKEAIDMLIHARPGHCTPPEITENKVGGANDLGPPPAQPGVKRSTLKRKSFIGKCHCGKCFKCVPSPSDWIWNGERFIQVSKEWKMSDMLESVQHMLVTLIENVEIATRKVVDQQHEAVASEVALGFSTFKPSYSWSTELIPLFAKFNQTLEGLFKVSTNSLSFAMMQFDSYVVGVKDLKRRRDVVFSQVLTSLVTSFYMVLSKYFLKADILKQIQEIGFLVYFESLLTPLGDESGMLEDMYIGVMELASVTFQLGQMREDEEGLPFDFRITGTRDSLTVQLLLSSDFIAMLPNDQLRRGEKIRVIPVIFSQGVNEKQTLANIKHDIPLMASGVELQEDINRQSISALSRYMEKFVKLSTRDTQLNLRAVKAKDLFELFKKSFDSHKTKNIESLLAIEQLVFWLRGGRLTSCKSGKDRTSMSVTLEECCMLRNNHHLNHSSFSKVLNTLRSHGTRLENCHKNTGHRCYHFNQLQLMMLPKLLTPPPFTCRDPE